MSDQDLKKDFDEKAKAAADEAEDVAEAQNEDKKAEDVKTEEADGEAAQETKAKDDPKLFKKKPKTDKKADKQKEKIDELEDRVKRQMAEFDNFRKRTEKEKAQMFEVGAKSVIEKILPVVDNFERGMATAPEGDAFAEGMNMIYKQLLGELDAIGVKPIEAVGKEFDTTYHNAVMQVQSEEYESGIVAQELQKGYTYRDQVVRPSMVAVAE